MSNITVEKGKRFSESIIWELQREYFEKQGINAWAEQVPFYVTSNPFIAHAYATIAIRLMCDYIKQHPESLNHTFYILELGAGAGQFSFYTLKILHQLRKSLGLEHIKFCYIMSDFTPNLIQFWEKHPSFKPFLDEGVLDFAVYHLEKEEPLTLVKSKKTLTTDSFVNPLMVCANYIFDTISHDAFGVKDGKLFELLTHFTTPEENTHHGKVKEWEKMEVDFNAGPIDKSYYEDPALNAVLEEYRTKLTETCFLIPIAGIKAIKKLQKLAGKVLLVSSDKGYGDLESIDRRSPPRPAFHGSFSMMVNYDAMYRYFLHSGNECILQSPRKGIKTMVASLGMKISSLAETSLAVKQHVEDFSPADYFILHRRISDSYDNCNLETLASHMALALWDPHIFARINQRMCSLLEDADPATIEFLAGHMFTVLDNFYDLPAAKNIPFEVGSFLYFAKRYTDALRCYQQAFTRDGEHFELRYNMALCYYYLDNYPLALTNFKRALSLNPSSEEAKGWITHVNQKT